jgi:predicted DNA-binding ribbon-helix-helix protein
MQNEANREKHHEGESRSTLVSRNITVLGRRTSVRLEPEMWTALRDIVTREKCRIHDICSLIELRKNRDTSLTAAIRVFIMLYFRAAATEEGHQRVGHGDFSIMLKRARMTRESFDIKQHNVLPEMPQPQERHIAG